MKTEKEDIMAVHSGNILMFAALDFTHSFKIEQSYLALANVEGLNEK